MGRDSFGAAILVDKKVVWMKGYGFADQEGAVPFTPDTIMNIGSISKTFTGAALMRAVQEERLSLDEDINVFLPVRVRNPFFPDGKITLRQLATHTSSITDRGADDDALRPRQGGRLARRVQLRRSPGIEGLQDWRVGRRLRWHTSSPVDSYWRCKALESPDHDPRGNPL